MSRRKSESFEDCARYLFSNEWREEDIAKIYEITAKFDSGEVVTRRILSFNKKEAKEKFADWLRLDAQIDNHDYGHGKIIDIKGVVRK